MYLHQEFKEKMLSVVQIVMKSSLFVNRRRSTRNGIDAEVSSLKWKLDATFHSCFYVSGSVNIIYVAKCILHILLASLLETFSKRIPSLRQKSYAKRLAVLNLNTLEFRILNILLSSSQQAHSIQTQLCFHLILSPHSLRANLPAPFQLYSTKVFQPGTIYL